MVGSRLRLSRRGHLRRELSFLTVTSTASGGMSQTAERQKTQNTGRWLAAARRRILHAPEGDNLNCALAVRYTPCTGATHVPPRCYPGAGRADARVCRADSDVRCMTADGNTMAAQLELCTGGV